MKRVFLRISDLIWIIAFILADRITKIIAQTVLDADREIILIKKIASLHLILNEGAIFSLPLGRLWLILGTITILVLLGWFYLKGALPRKVECFGVVLVFAGAIGNLADRIVSGKVVDWLSVSFWPAFNFADVLIIAGVVLIGLGVFKIGKKI